MDYRAELTSSLNLLRHAEQMYARARLSKSKRVIFYGIMTLRRHVAVDLMQLGGLGAAW